MRTPGWLRPAVSLTGTGALLRLALRRDRLWVLPWLIGIVTLTAVSVSSIAGLYPTATLRAAYGTTAASNPALIAMSGRGYELSSLGGLTAWRIGLFAAVMAALMSIFLVIRHTRADEETGRTELVGSTIVGRRAALSSALTVAGLANLALVVLLTAALSMNGLPLSGSFALALSIGLAGAAFACIAAVVAQCATTARGATGAASAILGVAFLVRAAGDLADNGAGWLSPLGWVTRLRPFADERWEVLGLFALLLLLTSGLAFVLTQRREYGAGLLAPRSGRGTGGASLSGPVGLAWRLQRGALVGWCLGFVVMGAAYGALAKDVAAIVGDSPALIDIVQRLGGAAGIVDAYLTTTFDLVGMLAAGYVIASILRLRQEETSGYAEALLASPLARVRWASGHIVVACAGATVMLAISGASTGLVHGLRTGDVGGQLGRLTLAALAQSPAVWIVGAVTVLLVGWLPHAASASWGVLVTCVVLGQFGALLWLPQALIDVSPFGHVPGIANITVAPLTVLTLIALGLAGAGLLGLRRRDIG